MRIPSRRNDTLRLRSSSKPLPEALFRKDFCRTFPNGASRAKSPGPYGKAPVFLSEIRRGKSDFVRIRSERQAFVHFPIRSYADPTCRGGGRRLFRKRRHSPLGRKTRTSDFPASETVPLPAPYPPHPEKRAFSTSAPLAPGIPETAVQTLLLDKKDCFFAPEKRPFRKFLQIIGNRILAQSLFFPAETRRS